MAQSSPILGLAASRSRSTPVWSLSNCYPDQLFRSARRLLHRIALRSNRRVQPIAATCDDAGRTNGVAQLSKPSPAANGEAAVSGQFCTDGGRSACHAASHQNEGSPHEYV